MSPSGSERAVGGARRSRSQRDVQPTAQARSGYRFFLAYADQDDLKADGFLAEPPADLSPLVSPWWTRSWPAGWVEAGCSEGCASVPGAACGCGMTFMVRPEQLAWYLLVLYRGAFVDNPRAVRRLAFTRVDVRGPVLSQNRPDHPSFERRAAACRTAEVWLPRAGHRFARLLEDHYDVPVHVSSLDGEPWLRTLCPEIQEIPDIPGASPRPAPPADPVDVVQRSLTMMRRFPDTPQTRASIARAEETLRHLHRRPEAAFVVNLRGLADDARDEALIELAAALPGELPAFRVTTWHHGHDQAEVVVTGIDGTPQDALARLDGWGHGQLTLRRVR